MFHSSDTIAAIATPPGRGGVAVIRVSGNHVAQIAKSILGACPKPRYATFAAFNDEKGASIDEGVAIYFEKPHSFTGEDVLELQGHGSPVVMDQLLRRVVSLGARMANPGEFSLRAFLNNKIDLMQAESIADLIEANTVQAARSAMRSLQGDFSKKISSLLQQMIRLRILVEASIDFPEEEIDFLSDGKIKQELVQLISSIKDIQRAAKQGALLQEGIRVVIAGEPNVGKSSLLNCLSGRDAAIVTEIAGTTRDVLKETIQIDGIPLHIVDTAGLRETCDTIEQEGMRRAEREMDQADMILVMVDATKADVNLDGFRARTTSNMTIIANKIDLMDKKPEKINRDEDTIIYLSAKTGSGIDILKTHLKEQMGYNQSEEGHFMARRRHLDALARALSSLEDGLKQLEQHRAGELLAENLRQAQQALSEITGEFTSDDLLGKIFSEFCIGK